MKTKNESLALINQSEAENDDDSKNTSYKRGLHRHVPAFNVDDELDSSRYTSQMEALYWLLHGDNVILCGSAGAGKSWVIDRYQDIIHGFQGRLENEGRHMEVAVTASTGAAAALIFGRTIHSWSGLGIRVDEFNEANLHERDKRVWLNAKKRIRGTDVLIIDEVSMLPAYFLANLDRACRIAKGRQDKPFGGLQVILVGDFLQLPPVDTHQTDSDGNPVDGSYCFHARDVDGRKIFSSGGFRFCYLDKTRRSSDADLNALLNGIREGRDVSELRAMIAPRYHVKPDADKVYTRLRTKNRSVDEYNQERLDSLPGKSHVYGLHRSGDPDDCKELITAGKLRPLELKEGAIVMLTSNGVVPGYVNGSMGKVVHLGEDVDAITGRTMPVIKVRMNSMPSDVAASDAASRSKKELDTGSPTSARNLHADDSSDKTSDASTVISTVKTHLEVPNDAKSQDNATTAIDAIKSDAKNDASSTGSTGHDSDAVTVDKNAISPALSEELRTVTIGYTAARKTHTDVTSDDTDEDGVPIVKEVEVVDATVSYVPLRLAWAITVHKSQGQTLDGAVIDLSQCFQKGLGYVALSRCRSLDDVIMEGESSALPMEAFLIDPDARKADTAVRRRAVKAREDLKDNEDRVRDLYTALSVASSKAARGRIKTSIGRDISIGEMFKDDESCYQYVKKNRTRILRRR